MDNVLFVNVGDAFCDLLCDFPDFMEGHAKAGVVFEHVGLEVAFLAVL